MAKRHPEHEEHADETWLIPYADLLTLLLALFIVLFASSQTDQEKFEEFIRAFNESTGGQRPVIITPPDGHQDGTALLPPIFDWPDYGPPKPTPTPGDAGNPGKDKGEYDDPVGMFKEKMEDWVYDLNLTDRIGVERKGENVLVTLTSDIWFDSGKADVTPGMREIAKDLAMILLNSQNPDNPFEISVSGHTDTVPMNTPQYPSNWHLSMGRATNFLVVLVEESGMDPAFFNAKGFGEQQPIATNSTDEGRRKNRRVELLVALSKTEDEGYFPETE